MKRFLIGLPLLLATFAAGVYWGPQLAPHLAPYLTAVQRLNAPENRIANEEEARTAPPAVSVVKVAQADFTETVAVSGSLVPRDEILVAPEVEGFRVLELMVDEGDRVKKGDVLATLVQESLDAQLAQTTASLARAEAAVSRAQTQIDEAEARLNEANAAFERAKPLKKSGYLSESTFDQRQASAATTSAQLAAARQGLLLAQAEKAQVEAQQRELTWRQSKTKVTAPEDGLVSRRTARIGGLASAIAEPLFRIIARGEVELDAEVLETELGKIAMGQKAYVNVAGNGEVTGKVRLVSPEVDQATRLGRVRIFLGDDPKLHIGSFARGTIATARGRALAVPASAVVFDADGTFVQVVVDGHVARRNIETGLQANGLVEARSGLAEGDVVVARAGTFLSEGDAVRTVFPAAKISEAR
jgi:RND family efflux transporter MFP subunit